MSIKKLYETLKSFTKFEASINPDLEGLVAPKTQEPFPLYPEDMWQGIYSKNGNFLIGNSYWAKGGGRFGPHHHDFDEIGYIFSGSCILEQKGKKAEHLTIGKGWKIPAGTEHAMDWIEDCVIVIRWAPPLAQGVWTFGEDDESLLEGSI